jgi:hypothetical protein
MYDLAAALVSLRPGAAWTLSGEEYSGLSWLDSEQTQPTEAECIAEMARLQADYESKEYQRLRAKEYPSFADQFDTLYHGGLAAWQAEIQAVKDKYPKPE